MRRKMKIFSILKMKYYILGLMIAISGSYAYAENGANYPEISYQQSEVTITGKVVDADGVPLPGVSVVVKNNPTKGVATDFDGKYTIKVSKDATLVFSYVGFKPQEVNVKKNLRGGQINVTMVADAQQLDDVVVTAYGTGQKKVSIVGSVQTIKPAELKVPSANLSSGFAGRMAGVIAVQRGGEPGGDGSDFWVRGISTLGGAAVSPLIILDGVQVSSADLNALDTEVIDSFSILKDATATALYGSRGANGVMIVTTKSGADLKKPVINVRLETSISAPTSRPKFVDGVTYMKLYNEGVKNLSSNVLPYSDEKIEKTAQGANPYVFPNVDWYDEVFEPFAVNQRVNVNIRGGGKKLNYFMNGALNHDTGMIRDISRRYFSFNNNIDVMRYAFQNNINLNLSETSKVSLKINSQFRDRRDPRVGVNGTFGKIMDINPVDFPVYYPDTEGTGVTMWGAYGGGTTAAGTNPVANLVNGYNDTFESTVIANLNFDQKLDFLLDGLKFSAMASFKNWSKTVSKRSAPINTFELNSYTLQPNGKYDYVVNSIGNVQTVVLGTNGETTGDRRIYLQGLLDYNKTFGGVHSVNALLVYNQEETALNNIAANEAFDRLLNSLPRRRQGLAGRLSYAYDNRYLIEFNAGYNGSENFAKGKRFGFFPSVALGYNISEEAYFKPLKDIVTWLKIRGSWGLVGNDKTGGGRFAYMSNIDLQDNNVKYRTGVNQNYELKGPKYERYANPDLTWEVGEKTNVGFDLQVLGKLNVTFDVFREIRSNIFQERKSIPTYLGAAQTKIFANYAKVQNWGIDGSVDYNSQISKNWYASVKGTFTFARNKVLRYDEPAFQKYPQLSMVGHRLNTHVGYVAEGLFIDQAQIDASPSQQINGSGTIAAGDIKYKNMPDNEGNYDNVITKDDRAYIGYPTVPEIVYGFGANFKYKNLDFGFFLQGVANTSLMMQNFHPFGTQKRRNVLEFIAEDYWDSTNQNIYAAYPRLTHDDHANNTAPSTFWLRDASFLKLKNVEVGFTIPKYQNVRIYLTATNLYTFSKFKLWDPEQGGNAFAYPTQRVLNFGLQMTLK